MIESDRNVLPDGQLIGVDAELRALLLEVTALSLERVVVSTQAAEEGVPPIASDAVDVHPPQESLRSSRPPGIEVRMEADEPSEEPVVKVEERTAAHCNERSENIGVDELELRTRRIVVINHYTNN